MIEKLYSLKKKPCINPTNVRLMAVEYLNEHIKMVMSSSKTYVVTKADNQIFATELEEDVSLEMPLFKTRFYYGYKVVVDEYSNGDLLLVLREYSNTRIRMNETILKRHKNQFDFGKEVSEFDIWKKHKKGEM